MFRKFLVDGFSPSELLLPIFARVHTPMEVFIKRRQAAGSHHYIH
jgi:hypothetical protein